MIILHPFASAGATRIRQGATWAMLEALRRHGRHVVVDWPCSADLDYLEAIRSCWSLGRPLCIVEHDVVTDLASLVSLEECPQPICQAAYQLHPGSTGLSRAVWAWRNQGQWGKQGDEFADSFSLGCTAFKERALRAAEPSSFIADSWSNVDIAVNTIFAARGFRAHIHWPAAVHHH